MVNKQIDLLGGNVRKESDFRRGGDMQISMFRLGISNGGGGTIASVYTDG